MWQSNLENAAPDRDGHRMSPVVGLQAAHNVLDVEVHGSLRNAELRGDLLVLRTVLNQSENLNLTFREGIVAPALRETRRDIRGHASIPRMHRPNYRQQFIPARAFQDIARRTGAKCALDLCVGFRRG